MVRDVLRAKVYTYGVWRMLEMLVKGERRGGGLLCVLLVQLPSLAHGCRRMEKLEVLIRGSVRGGGAPLCEGGVRMGSSRGSVRGGGAPLWEGGELAGALARCRHSSLRGLLPAQAGQGVSVLDVWTISLRCRKSIDHLGECILSRSFVISVLLCPRGVRFGLGPHVRET